MEEIAFLVFAPMRQRRADDSFDGNDNIGAKVVQDVLERTGLRIGFCSPESAHRYRLVLVSLTSTYDMASLYCHVALREDWQPGKRTFKVLCGGFGMQNPRSIRRYIDYAVFGRAEAFVGAVVANILDNRTPDHASVMHLPDVRPVVFSQAQELYPYEVSGWKEEFTGCPLKCKFCHYTYVREHKGSDESYAKGEYVQNTLTGGGTPEVTWNQLLTWSKKAGRIRVAIDGFSERIRFTYGKRITNDDIVAGIENMGSYEGTTTLLVYNIANFPGETQEDREELYDTLKRAQPKHRVIFVLQSTPFRPSLLTPMQWEPVNLTPDNSKLRASIIVSRPNLHAIHSFTLETSWSHLQTMVIERHSGSKAHDNAFHAMCFNKKIAGGSLRHADRLRIFQANFDTRDYLRAYELDEPHPGDILQGTIKPPQLRKVAAKMRDQFTNEPIRGRKSLSGRTIRIMAAQ